MLDQAKTRTLPLLNRTVDLAPAAQACCGVCRTCATTNLLTLAGALVAGAAAFALRLRERLG
jgi:threonine aldolase